MEMNSKGDNVAPDSVDNVTNSETATNTDVDNVASNDTVDYNNYRRQVSKVKNLQTELENERLQRQQLEQQKLEAEGKKDELISSLKSEINSWKSKAQSAVTNFAKMKVHETMVNEAAKLGCQDPELLVRAYGSDIDAIDFDESFNPDRDQIKMTLERIRSERPFLFSKPAPNIGKHQIKPAGAKTNVAKKISELNDDELMKAWQKSERG